MPVTPRRGVARLYQSDLRPPAAGTASFLRDLDFESWMQKARPAPLHASGDANQQGNLRPRNRLIHLGLPMHRDVWEWRPAFQEAYRDRCLLGGILIAHLRPPAQRRATASVFDSSLATYPRLRRLLVSRVRFAEHISL